MNIISNFKSMLSNAKNTSNSLYVKVGIGVVVCALLMFVKYLKNVYAVFNAHERDVKNVKSLMQAVKYENFPNILYFNNLTQEIESKVNKLVDALNNIKVDEYRADNIKYNISEVIKTDAFEINVKLKWYSETEVKKQQTATIQALKFLQNAHETFVRCEDHTQLGKGITGKSIKQAIINIVKDNVFHEAIATILAIEIALLSNIYLTCPGKDISKHENLRNAKEIFIVRDKINAQLKILAELNFKA